MERAKRFLACFLAVAMLVVNVPVYAFSGTGATAKAEYLKVENRFFSTLKNSFEKSEYGKIVEFSKGIDGAYNGKTSIEVKIPDVKTRKYVVNENATYLDRYADGSFEGYVEGEKVATLNFIANEEVVSFQIPELYEKFWSMDMSNLHEMMLNLGYEDYDNIDALPTGMVYNSDIISAVKFTKAEEKVLNDAKVKYLKLLNNGLLKNSYFSKGSKEVLTLGGKNYKCDKVTYSITLDKLIEEIEKLWEAFKDDTELFDLLWSKFENFCAVMGKVNSDYRDMPSKDTVIFYIDYAISQLKDNELPDVISSTLYHKNGKLLKRVLYLNGNEVLTVSSVKNSKDGYYAFTMPDFSVEDSVSVLGKDTTHDITIICDDEVNNVTAKITKASDKKITGVIYWDVTDANISFEYLTTAMSSKECGFDFDIKYNTDDGIYGLDIASSYRKDIKLNKKSVGRNVIDMNSVSVDVLGETIEEISSDTDKATKFLNAFYYDEIMTFIESFYSMSEKDTAKAIGKAVRVWYTDYSTDYSLIRKLNAYNNISSDKWVLAERLSDIGEYIQLSSLRESSGECYYVGLNRYGAIVVALLEEGEQSLLPSPYWIEDADDFEAVLFVEPLGLENNFSE